MAERGCAGTGLGLCVASIARATAAVVALLLLLGSAAVGDARAQSTDGQPAREPESLRDSIVRAIHPDATYTADLFADAVGGRERGVVHTGNVQLTMRIESEPLIGWSGAQLFMHTLTTFGGQPSRLVGDAQGVDNVSTAPATLTLYEAWLSQLLMRNRVSVLLGFYDLNSEFDVSFPGTAFVHSAHGMGSALGLSGVSGPSIYPVTSLGARVKVLLAPNAYVQAVALNGKPGNVGGASGVRLPHARDGALFVSEVGAFYGLMDPQDNTPGARRRYIRRQAQPRYRIKGALGAWAYTAKFPDVASYGQSQRPAVYSGDYGVYALVDGLLIQANEGTRKGLWGFARIGATRPQVDRYPYFVGAGLVYRGPIVTRDNDELGFAVALAKASARYREAQIAAGQRMANYEVAYEVTYLAPLTNWLTLQLDLQYIVDPNATEEIPNALAGLVRYQVAF